MIFGVFSLYIPAMSMTTLHLMEQYNRQQEKGQADYEKKCHALFLESSPDLEARAKSVFDICAKKAIKHNNGCQVSFSKVIPKDVVGLVSQRFEKLGWSFTHSQNFGYNWYVFITIKPPKDLIQKSLGL